MEKQIELVSIEKDVLDFYKRILFGSFNDPFEAACFRAYRDFNRTLHLSEAGINDADKRIYLRQHVTCIIRESVTELLNSKCKNQDEFDKWHEKTAKEIRDWYPEKVHFTYGHAQKWLNMALKYLYILGACDFKELTQFFHPPLDNYILQAAKIKLGIKKPHDAWSTWDDYSSYLDYQKQLRAKIDEQSLFRWEFHTWNYFER